MSEIKFEHPGWFPQVASARFSANPTAATLSAELSWLASKWDPIMRFARGVIPWPLSACIRTATSSQELAELSRIASEGGLGDNAEWSAAETRWRNEGIVDADLIEITDEKWPFDANIANRGFPMAASTWVAEQSGRFVKSERHLQWLREMSHGKMRSWIASTILSRFRFPWSDRERNISMSQYRELFEMARIIRIPDEMEGNYWLDNLVNVSKNVELSVDTVAFIDWLGKEGHRFQFERNSLPFAEQLRNQFCANPSEWKGLLPVILCAAASGFRCEVPRETLNKADHWSNKAKIEANTLRLAIGDTTSVEINRIAKKLLNNEDQGHSIWRSLMVASTHSSDREALLALAILETIDANASEISGSHSEVTELGVQNEAAMDQSLRALVEYLISKPSNFGAQRLCSGLNLPEFK